MSLSFAVSRFARAIWQARTGGLRPVVHPPEDGPHGAPIEWWYLVGHLETVDVDPTERVSFELTFAQGTDPLTGWGSGRVGIFAWIEAAQQRYRVVERPDLLSSAWALESGRLRLELGGPSDRAMARTWVLAGADGQFDVRAMHGDRGLDLSLRSTKPAALFGTDGVVNYGGEERMAWVSWTRLRAEGSARIDGVTRRVRGQCWMDHQWGAPALSGYRWKVVSVQLGGDVELLAFRMQDQRGRPVQTLAAKVAPDGSVVQLEGDGVQLVDVGAGLNVSGVRYQHDSTLRVPAWGVDLSITAVMVDQRKRTARRLQLFPVWWEGACTVSGMVAGESASGVAFTEIAGLELSAGRPRERSGL